MSPQSTHNTPVFLYRPLCQDTKPNLGKTADKAARKYNSSLKRSHPQLVSQKVLLECSIAICSSSSPAHASPRPLCQPGERDSWSRREGKGIPHTGAIQPWPESRCSGPAQHPIPRDSPSEWGKAVSCGAEYGRGTLDNARRCEKVFAQNRMSLKQNELKTE